MASLQARHSKSCALGSRVWTNATPKSENPQDWRASCTCAPTYYLVSSLKRGGRNPVGKNYPAAKRAFTAAQSAQDRGEEVIADNRTFAAWADAWLASLQRANENTRRSYVSTLDYAKDAFGKERLRKVSVDDVRKFLASMTRTVKREGKEVVEPISASTRAKHLRVLSHCFRDAVTEGLLASNPIDRLPASQRPHAETNEAPYFTDGELPPLITALNEHDKPLLRLAVLTGMRLGELLALRWSHVDLVNATIHVRQTYVDGIGATAPKSKRSVRDVHLTSAAVELLGELWGEDSKEDDLVFPPLLPTAHGYRIGGSVTKALYKAMEAAGIPRAGSHLKPPTEKGRTFHSLRHTYARIALENGIELTWLSRQMGHATAAFTEQRYGHWSEEARKREVAKLDEAAAFSKV